MRVTLAPDGEILVEGPTVAGGGTLHTGDLGRFDDRGRLIVVGRKSDTIVTGGENVAPAEVEAVLLEHPAVADAGVFARPHAEWGEAVTARVVLRPGADASADELRDWAAESPRRLQGPEDGRAGGRAAAHRVGQAAAKGARMTRARWADIAKGWETHADAFRRNTMPVSTWMVDAIAPQPGHTVLDLAAGIGDVGFLAAEMIEPGGTLITSDFVPEMLSAAQRRAETLGDPQRALPADRRADDGHRGRDARRRAVPLGLHADGRPGGRPARDPARAAARRARSRSPPGRAPRTTRGARSPSSC